jgi:hypothetical protein
MQLRAAGVVWRAPEGVEQRQHKRLKWNSGAFAGIVVRCYKERGCREHGKRYHQAGIDCFHDDELLLSGNESVCHRVQPL